MKRIERFTLLAHRGEADTEPLGSFLIADGELTSVRIPGIEILEQFEIIAGYLLVTDHDCPFEETFHFILLDHHLHIISQRSLGARFSFVPGEAVRSLQKLSWEDDWHFVAYLGGDTQRWRFTIRRTGLPFLYPRLTATRIG
jgi:hypothetical protein